MHGCEHSIGCLTASAWRVGGGLSVSAKRVDFKEEKDGLVLSAWRIGNELKVSAGLTCTTNPDIRPYEYFMVAEGIFVFVDGEEFKVLRNGISE